MTGQLVLRVSMAMIAFVSFGGHLTLAGPCDGSPEALTVDYTAKKVYSPGYPARYDNNLKCEWLLEANPGVRPGFGIQLATLELELDPSFATTVGECDDFLEVFEGAPSNQGPSLGRWCGRTLKIIKSMATSLTLRFSTNGLYTGKGFVIEYSLVRVASAECLPGRTTPVHVGRAPLYESFEVKSSESRCTWTVEAIAENGDSDHDSIVVIEAFSVPKVFCENGKFIVYDGQSTSSPKVLEWCDTEQAFSRIYLSSSYATLTFLFVEGEELNSDIDAVHLKIYTQSSQYDCSDANLPSIDVGLDPVYFSLPFTKSSSGAACKVHVSQRVRDSVRVDVIGVRGQEIACGSNIIIVKQASNNAEVEKSCSRRRHPTYLPFQSDVIVATKNPASRVYLRAVSSDHFCDGRVIAGQAYDSFITEKTLPREGDVDNIQNNCYSRFLITAKDEQRAISLRLQWRPQADTVFSGTDVCEGDFVNVYDGNSESDPLLFSSCRKTDMAEGYVSTRLFGRQGQMLILFNTDEKNSAQHVSVWFHSLPAMTELCESMQEIMVDRLPQNLTSLNYPDSYPLDYSCTYRLTANESDVVVVEAVDTRFASGCGDILTIYDGISTTQPGRLLARLCGHDAASQKFVSQYNETTVKFVSNKFGPNPGGWRLLVYSEPKSLSGVNQCVGSLVITILLVFLCSIMFKV